MTYHACCHPKVHLRDIKRKIEERGERREERGERGGERGEGRGRKRNGADTQESTTWRGAAFRMGGLGYACAGVLLLGHRRLCRCISILLVTIL